jgi:OmpA-OmpF porin, OOP family
LCRRASSRHRCPRPAELQSCKDSPLISRFPGSIITDCVDRQDDIHDFGMGDGKPPKRLEGNYQMIAYSYPKTASKAVVLRNVHTAIKSAGYIFDYDSGDFGDFTVHLGKTWIGMEVNSANNYKEYILVETAVTQEVVANAAAMSSGIAASGHIAVNGILFDTGKADVKPDSAPALEQVAKLIKASPALKLYVVGHTDNVGGLAANLDLSKRRAAAVVQTLITQYGIPAARLEAYGSGPLAPVASIDLEDGRSLNRCVELVKQ